MESTLFQWKFFIAMQAKGPSTNSQVIVFHIRMNILYEFQLVSTSDIRMEKK